MRKRVWLQALLSTLVISTLIACVTNAEPAGSPPPIRVTPSPKAPQPTFQSPIPQTSIATSSPTATPSSAWQTYHDPSYGLTLQYPSDWNQSIAFSQPYSKSLLRRVEVTHWSQARGDNAEILIDIRLKYGDLFEWLREKLMTDAGSLYLTADWIEGGVNGLADYNAQLAGRPAIFVYQPEHNSGTPDMAQLYVADGDYFYVFTYWGDIPDNMENRATYLRILETVSFAHSTVQGLSVPKTAFTNQIPSAVATASPVSGCPLPESLKVPGISQFDPVDGKGAIAYSADGLQLVFLTSLLTKTVHSPSALHLNGVDRDFIWSPDATRVAFLYTDSRPDPCGYGYLMLADLVKGEARPLIQEIARYGQPIWSPDGQRLALIDDAGQLEVVHINNSTLTLVTDHAAALSRPAWLDAEHIVYAERAKSNNLTDLVSQALDGSAPQTLLSDVRINEFALAPDNRHVAYFGGALYAADLQSNSAENLGSNPSERLQWSPNGNYLLGRGGLAGIFLVQPHTAMPVSQANFLGVPGSMQSWSPDGHRFAVLIGPEDKLPTIGIYDVSTHLLKDLSVVVQSPYALAWSTQD